MAKGKTKNIQPIDKKECSICHRELAVKTNFYLTNNKLFSDGRIPICKKCIKERIDYSNMETIYDMLRQMDLPFIYEYWKAVLKGDKDPFGIYVSKCNSLPQLIGMTWKDSVFNNKQSKQKEDSEFPTINTTINEQIHINANFDELIKKWGKGYTKEQYIMLEDIYEDMCLDFTIDNRSQEEYLRTACLYQLKNKESIAEGNAGEAQKWGQMFDRYMESGKLKPAQFNRSEMGNVNGFSEFFEFVEKQGFALKFPDLILDDIDYAIFSFINYNRTLLGHDPAKLGDIKDFMNYDYIKGQEIVMPENKEDDE